MTPDAARCCSCCMAAAAAGSAKWRDTHFIRERRSWCRDDATYIALLLQPYSNEVHTALSRADAAGHGRFGFGCSNCSDHPRSGGFTSPGSGWWPVRRIYRSHGDRDHCPVSVKAVVVLVRYRLCFCDGLDCLAVCLPGCLCHSVIVCACFSQLSLTFDMRRDCCNITSTRRQWKSYSTHTDRGFSDFQSRFSGSVVSDRRTFTGLHRTFSWWVTIYG